LNVNADPIARADGDGVRSGTGDGVALRGDVDAIGGGEALARAGDMDALAPALGVEDGARDEPHAPRTLSAISIVARPTLTQSSR